MRHAKRKTMLAVAVICVLAARAAADPVYHLKTPSSVHTDGGADLRLPPGYFLDEPRYDSLNTEMKRLQDSETRLKAENNSFRGSMASWQPGWYVLSAALVVGFALGVYVAYKL